MSRDSCLSITHLFNPQRPRWTFAVWVLSATQCWDRSNNNSQPFRHCSELFIRIFLTVMWPFTSFHTPSTWIESALLVSPTSPSSVSDQISEATHLNLTTPHLNTIAPQSLQVCTEPLVFLDENQLYLANKPDYASHSSLSEWGFHSVPFPSRQAWVSSLTLLLIQLQIKMLPASTLAQSHQLPNSNCCLHHDLIPFFPPTASPSSFSSSALTSTRPSIHTCRLFFTSQPSLCPQIRLLHHLSIPSAWTWKLAFKLFSVCF